jgi:hypothetical protein
VQVTFHNTHAYPGCRATVGAARGRSGKTMVEFSDGSIANGSYRKVGADEIVLNVNPYVTARKTEIGRKRWRLRHDQKGWKVIQKLA